MNHNTHSLTCFNMWKIMKVLFLCIRIQTIHGGKIAKPQHNVEAMIAALRENKRADIANKNNQEINSNLNSKHIVAPRPYDEKINAGNACPMRGLVVRREMGNLGVTSFQVVAAGLIMDALGPSWSYYDDWPQMAHILREDRHISKEEANEMRKTTCKHHITLNPSEQEELSLSPFQIHDGSWVKYIREAVCGMSAPWNRGKDMSSFTVQESDPCIVVKLQGHWEHAGYFYRYREFIASNILRSYNSMKTEYIDEIKDAIKSEVADLVVYLRLGDKSVAGDTTLTFASGYYDIVLTEARPKANTCWIITQTPREPRAKKLASKHRCSLVSSPKQYTDWTLLLTAPGTLVMAASTFIYFQALIGKAKEVHYPAVGFFHDKHNVCMRERNSASHFGQMRLPIDDPKMIYHDIYSRVWFMNYKELAVQVKSLPCDSILDQHVCDLSNKKFQFGAESRYCYRPQNTSTLAAQLVAQQVSHKHGSMTLGLLRSERG